MTRSPASGDGWAQGPGGKPAWGIYGAAGLFLTAAVDGQLCVLMQHRAEWTNQGGTWGLPGGARDRDESAAQAAVRETEEECGISPRDVEVLDTLVTCGPIPGEPDHELPGGWSYSTVLARTTTGAPLETQANAESKELRWVPLAEVENLPLLGAFAQAYPLLREQIERLNS